MQHSSSSTPNHHVRFEVFTAVTMKNASFWDVAPCGCYENRRTVEHVAYIFRVERISELKQC
jgi:hypothetical protein